MVYQFNPNMLPDVACANTPCAGPAQTLLFRLIYINGKDSFGFDETAFAQYVRQSSDLRTKT